MDIRIESDVSEPSGESLFLWVLVLLMMVVAFAYSGYAYKRQSLLQENIIVAAPMHDVQRSGW